MVARIGSPPGTSPRPSRPSESVTMAMLRVKYGPCAPLRLSSIESWPATGTTSTCGDRGVVTAAAALRRSGGSSPTGCRRGPGRAARRRARPGRRPGAGTARSRGCRPRCAGVGGRRERAAVDHRVADLDAGRPAVEEDPTRLELQDAASSARAASACRCGSAWTVAVSWPSRESRCGSSSSTESKRTTTPEAPKTSSVTGASRVAASTSWGAGACSPLSRCPAPRLGRRRSRAGVAVPVV